MSARAGHRAAAAPLKVQPNKTNGKPASATAAATAAGQHYSMSDNTESRRRIRVYRNGDSFDSGTKFVLDIRKVSALDGVLDAIGEKLRMQARRLYTTDGRLVRLVDTLHDGQDYVVSSGGFSPLPYGRAHRSPSRQPVSRSRSSEPHRRTARHATDAAAAAAAERPQPQANKTPEPKRPVANSAKNNRVRSSSEKPKKAESKAKAAQIAKPVLKKQSSVEKPKSMDEKPVVAAAAAAETAKSPEPPTEKPTTAQSNHEESTAAVTTAVASEHDATPSSPRAESAVPPSSRRTSHESGRPSHSSRAISSASSKKSGGPDLEAESAIHSEDDTEEHHQQHRSDAAHEEGSDKDEQK